MSETNDERKQTVSSSAINAQLFQAKIGSIQNQADSSSVYSNGVWSFKNSTALTSVTITDAGNVGVGVTPSAWSNQFKAIQIGSRSALYQDSNAATAVGNNIYNDGTNRYLTTGAATVALQDSGAHIWYGAASGTAGNAITFAERMRIDASGRVDLGALENAPPTYRGKIRLSTSARTTEGGIEFLAATSGGGYGFRIVNPDDTNGITPLVFQARTASATWAVNALTLHNNGNYAFAGSNVSDARLKEDIRDVGSQLQNVLALAPKTFRFKGQPQEDGSTGEPGRVQHGFIAQEVKAVLPSLVTGAETNPDEYMGVDYLGLTSVLVKAIQEQQAQIEALKAEVAALKAP